MKQKALKNKLRCRMKTMSCSSQVALYGIRYGKEKRPFITAYIKHKNNTQSKQNSSQDLETLQDKIHKGTDNIIQME